ncbi:MAG: phytoene/squalene synthase family protein [Bradyrhizobiaceae bacterium]|nr:phytoene/squalene synthase family protein [Bradyrhizobiaceae bacterium]
MQDAYAHCQALVREVDRDRYLASLFVPETDRRHLFALYAFNAEIASVRERVREPMAGEIRLQWWRDALAGRAAGEAGGSPVAAALLDTIEQRRLPRADLERLIEARAFDLYNDPMPNRAAFEGYLRATSSLLFALAGRLAGGTGEALNTAAEHAGFAYGITGLLRAFPLHASRGQIFLPHDLLDQFNVRADDVLTGQGSPALAEALRALRGEARSHLQAARERLSSMQPGIQAAFLPLALVDAYLARMEATNYDPFHTPIEVPQWRRQWTLWRAARRLRG